MTEIEGISREIEENQKVGSTGPLAISLYGTHTILIILIVGRPEVLVTGVFEFLDSQPAVSVASLEGIPLYRPVARQGAVRDGSP